MKHFISLKDADAPLLEELVNRALTIKKSPDRFSNALKGKRLYMLFQKTSTRTALSFGVGISDMGGFYFMQNWEDSNFAVGQIEDEVRYVGRNNEPSIDNEAYEIAKQTNRFKEIDGKTLSRSELSALIDDADVVYTDTWVDMEFFNDKTFEAEKDKRINAMMPFQLNVDLLGQSKVRVMHDMPIHAGYEISRDVVEKHIDTILLQAENRRHAQNGIMLTLLEDRDIASLFALGK